MLNNIIKIEIFSNNFLIDQKTLKRNISNFGNGIDWFFAYIIETILRNL